MIMEETTQLQAPPAQPVQEKKKKKKVVQAPGKRKKSVARAAICEGKGSVRINSMSIDLIEPRYRQMRIKEVLILAGDVVKGLDIDVSVRGGGTWGQADAVRTAIANALVKWTKSEALKRAYNDYDKNMLVSDSRRTEPHKPSRSSAGPRRSKQQSKR